jgi:hypothetical protein
MLPLGIVDDAFAVLGRSVEMLSFGELQPALATVDVIDNKGNNHSTQVDFNGIFFTKLVIIARLLAALLGKSSQYSC